MSFYNLALLYENVFKINGEKIALCYSTENSSKSISFTDLSYLSNRISHYLVSLSLSKGDVITILNDKSPMGFATMLGAIQEGIAYINLDPNSPPSRINKINEICKPKVLFFSDQYIDLANDLAINKNHKISYTNKKFLLDLNKFPNSISPNIHSLTGETPAYIMFTSGSTGFPKGAVMTHGNVLNLIKWSQKRFKLNGNEIFTNVNPLYFDNSVFDFYCSLFNGIALAPFTNDETRQAKKLVLSIEEIGCTHWFSVPSLLVYLLRMKSLSNDSIPILNTITFGGEGFPKNLLRKLNDLFPKKKLINVYGPTECSCICSSYVVRSEDMNSSSLLPLGTINQNFEYLILDENEKEVPKNNIGELFLLGPCVGKGYYNSKDRTKEVFIQNPQNNSYSELGYKTGDLVWEDSGTGLLHFQSRKDYQIKHMGYRIELQEIEATLGGLPNVVECAVLYHKNKDASSGQITAYVVTQENASNANEIIELLRNDLPYHMIPQSVKFSKSLPKNSNGKIDRLAIASL